MNPLRRWQLQRDAIGGAALAVMLPVTVLASQTGLPLVFAGLLAWLAGVCLWPRAVRAQRIQFGLLLGGGLGCALAAAVLGEPVSITRLIEQNQGLLGMLAAVTFLRLVALPTRDAGAGSPQGLTAFVKTIFGLHLFGSVINMSALVIVGDRLAAASPLQRTAAVMLSRGFSSAAYWSPFFAAMATALTYAPGAHAPTLLLAGLPLALFALGFTSWQLWRQEPAAMQGFRGYPLRLESLWLPVCLAALVMLMHWLLPGWGILALITLLAPAVTIVALCWRSGARGAARALARHVTTAMPGMHGELLLFLAAGVLGAGLFELGNAIRGGLAPIEADALSLALALLAMTAAALIGIHPVVSIAAVAAVLGPLAEPTVVAFAYLAAWGIGAAASPLSGIHLLLQGRYGLSGFTLMQWNLSYTLVMTAAAALGIWLIA